MGLSMTVDPVPAAPAAGAAKASGTPARTWHRLVVVVPASAADEVGAGCFQLGSCGLQAEEAY